MKEERFLNKTLKGEIFKFLWFSENEVRRKSGFSISSSSEVFDAVRVTAALCVESDYPSPLNNVEGGSCVLASVVAHGNNN